MASASPDPVQVKDGNGRWLESNPAALKAFDLAEGEYKGETDLELANRNSQRREAHLICASSDAQAWKKKTMTRSEEVVTAEDGTRTVFDVLKIPLFHADGRRKHLVVFGRDITIQKHAEEALLSSEARIRTILDVAAHELRTPLTPLRLLLDQSRSALAAGKQLDPRVLERMHRQTTRLTHLTNQIIDVARVERGNHPGGAPPRMAIADLRALVTPVIEELRSYAPKRAIHLEVGDTAAWILAAPGALERVVTSLVDNALKYTPGPLGVKIEVGTADVRFLVTDHGPGISREDRLGLFTRFYRVATEATIQHPGLGLGLFLSRELIFRHGGSMGLESDADRGSTFYSRCRGSVSTRGCP